MKKLYILSFLLCLASSFAYSQVIKPDVVLSPNGPNTTVYWNVKFKTMIMPHFNKSARPTYQDTVGAIFLNTDTTDKHIYIRYKMGAGGIIAVANLGDIGSGNSHNADSLGHLPPSYYLNRANHTGTQAESTIVNLVSDLASKAPLNSAAFTGTPTAPTVTFPDSSLKLVNTAYLTQAIDATTEYFVPGTFVGSVDPTTPAPGSIGNPFKLGPFAGSNIYNRNGHQTDTLRIDTVGAQSLVFKGDSTFLRVDRLGIHTGKKLFIDTGFAHGYTIQRVSNHLTIGKESGPRLNIYDSGTVCINCAAAQTDFGFALTIANFGSSGILLAGALSIGSDGHVRVSELIPKTDSTDRAANTRFVHQAIDSTITARGGGGGTTTHPLTINNSGAGDVSGTTFDGSAGKTISYNSIGAAPASGSTSIVTVGTLVSGSIPYSLITGTPSALPPNGTAGGDLSGSYPNPAVNQVNGITKNYYDPTSSIQTQLNGKQASLGFTAENVANKSTTTTLGTSNTLYPTQNAVKVYVDNAVAGVTGSVTSVFGRTGIVVAAANDYTFAQLASKPTTVSGYGITDVLSQALTGYVSGAGTVSATDNILQAFQKINGNVVVNTSSISTNTTAIAAKAASLIPTTVKTSSYTLAVNDYVPTNSTSGTVPLTLPGTPANGSLVGVKMVIQGSTNTTTITAGGSDVFNKTGGSTSLTLSLVNQGVLLEYYSGIWYVLADDLPLGPLDSRYVSISAPQLTTTSTIGYVWTATDGAGHGSFQPATGGSSTTPVTNEVPSGAINGSNVAFTAAHSPVTGALKVYINGIHQIGYTNTGTSITLATAPFTGDSVTIDYAY